MGLLLISFFLKTLKLVLIILNISYFLGMLWYILIEAEKDFINGKTEYSSDEDLEEFEDTFIVYFGLHEKDPKSIWIITTYFSFTSLSTVGFGDYHPRSNIERMVGSFILLWGVAIFSFIMGNFIDILTSI